MQSPRTRTPVGPDTVSQAGAGALLLSVAVAELWLAFSAAGWWHRAGAGLVAVAGAALVARAVAAMCVATHSRPAAARRHVWSLQRGADVVEPVAALAQPASRGAGALRAEPSRVVYARGG